LTPPFRHVLCPSIDLQERSGIDASLVAQFAAALQQPVVFVSPFIWQRLDG
jgi:hypothetical protein